MKTLLFILCWLIPVFGFGAAPNLTDYNPNQFATNGGKITIKNGATVTNLVGAGGDTLWTNSAGVVQLLIRTNILNMGRTTADTFDGDSIYNFPITGWFGEWALTNGPAQDFEYGGFELYITSLTNDTAYTTFAHGLSLRPTSDQVNTYNSATVYVQNWVRSNQKTGLDAGNAQFGIVGESTYYTGAPGTFGTAYMTNAQTVGVVGFGYGGVASLQAGVVGAGLAGINGQTNVGVHGTARLYLASSGTRVGVLGTVGGTGGGGEDLHLVSAAGLFDNRDTGLPVIIARTNGVEVFSVNNNNSGNTIVGGSLTVSNNLSVAGSITSVNGTFVNNMTDNWTNSGTVYSAIKMNVTNTASAFGSMLLDLRTNNQPIYRIRKELGEQLFNTYTDDTIYESGGMIWTNNILYIGTSKGSIGGTSRNVIIQTADGKQWIFGSGSGDFNSGHSVVLGATGALQWTGGSLIQGGFVDGNIRLFNAATTGFGMLQFGGTTASFPALKRSSTSLQVRLSDDSGDAPLSTGTLTIAGGSPILKVLSSTATLDFASLVSIGCEDLTITVTGASLGDTVSLGVPNSSVVANGTFTGWVSAADTVTVRFCTMVSGDPASGTFRATVTKF